MIGSIECRAKQTPETRRDQRRDKYRRTKEHRGSLRGQRHAHDRAAPRYRARAGGIGRSSRRRGALPPLRQGRRAHLDFDSVPTMRLFEDAGIIERHDFREGRARYETSPESAPRPSDQFAHRRGDRISVARRSNACRPKSHASSAISWSITGLSSTPFRSTTTRSVSAWLRALFDRGILFHDDAAIDLGAMVARTN